MREEQGLAVIEPEQQQELRKEIAPIVAQARALLVTTADEYRGASGFLKNTKAAEKRIVEFFAPMKEAAHQAHKKVCDAERSFLDPLHMAERDIKRKLGSWKAEQDRLAAAEQARLQAENEAKARRERERLEERARKAVDKGQVEKAVALAQQADEVVAPVVHVESAAPKVEGVSSRKVWTVTITDKKAYLAFVASEPTGMFLGTISINEAALKRMANGDKAPEIPGVEYKRDIQVIGRSN